jgi:cell wall assembly regulator SMI1
VLADGTPLFECTLHVRRVDAAGAGGDWLHTKLFPAACAAGPEWLPLQPSDHGEVEVIVKKPGFAVVVGRVLLGPQAGTFEPEMRPDIGGG